MPRFLNELTATQLSGEATTWRLWTLVHPLIYERGELGSGRRIVCPEGFISDGPTIPRLLWAILPVWGKWSRAGFVHDYICMLIVLGRPHAEAKTRDDADAIFYEAMQVLGTAFLTRWVLYIGVRIGTLIEVRPSMLDFNTDLLGGA